MKGGKLARLVTPARVLSLIVSDIVGDPVDMIASGPTIITSPQGTARTPLEILNLYNLTEKIPKHVLAVLTEKLIQEQSDAAEANVMNLMIGTNDIPLQQALRMTSESPLSFLLTRCLTGEARQAGRHLANLVRSICLQNRQDLEVVTEE